MTDLTVQTFKAQPVQSIVRAYVFEAPSGNWIVRDKMDNRGGLFTSKKAALKFVRHEFGSSTEIVMAAPEDTTTKSNHLQLLPSTQSEKKESTMSEVQGNTFQPQEDVFEKLESNVQSYARVFPRVFDKAVGTEVWDKDGRRYLDFLAGAGSLNYGHNNPVMKEALVDYIQSDAITHSLDLHTGAKEKFLTTMQDIILEPRGLDYVMQFTGPTGTNAVEAALKIARKVTGKTNVIFFTNGFHGVSMGSLAVTGNATLRAAAGAPLGGATSMPYDGYMGDDVDTISYLKRVLEDPSSGVDAPAAIILEIIQGEGGLNTARIEWLQRLQALCNEKKIPLIVDDIQAGCGRTGTFFSFEEAGLKPDIVTLSKSLSGYGLPFSIVLIKPELDQWKPGEHNGTFRGNNMAFVTAAKMLEHYWGDDTFENELKTKSAHLRKRLEAMVERHSSDLVEVKGRGFMIGVKCADAEQAALVTKNAFIEGLIIERCGPNDEIVKCMLPLTTTMAQIDEGLDILERVFEGLFNREGWDQDVHDIADAASLKGWWDVAAHLMIQQAERTAEAA